MARTVETYAPVIGTIAGSMVGAPELGAMFGVGGAAAGAAVGGLAGMGASALVAGSQKAATAGPPPQLAPTPTMPAINGPQIAAAQQASVAQQMSRGGRASTILNASPTDTLGG